MLKFYLLIVCPVIYAILMVLHLLLYKFERTAWIFAWYDLWVGLFWDSKKRWLYLFPLPSIGLVIKFRL